MLDEPEKNCVLWNKEFDTKEHLQECEKEKESHTCIKRLESENRGISWMKKILKAVEKNKNKERLNGK